ncbi:MAG TPA: TetR/AcrR family transcriptional regulator [Blastocatellia bacterium]|nr:TetR/AcrR family transcriptional regulator [Blastocatellia bacterium]
MKAPKKSDARLKAVGKASRQPMKNYSLLSDENSTDKFSAILRGAVQVFARSGYFNAKVAEVARAAGVADGTVYLYFKNKDDLLVSIFNTAMQEFNARTQQELTEIADPREQLRHFAKLHFEALEANRDLAVVFQVEFRHSTKFMEQFSETMLADYLKMLREILERGQKQGVFRASPNTKVVAKVIFGALDEMVTNWVLSHHNFKLTPMVDPVMDVFLHGINAEGVA